VTDIELAHRAKRGDVGSFGELVERYKERAYMMALGIVRNHEDAMDLSQEAFVKAWKSLRSFRDGSEFYPWFYAILRNTCLNALRSRRRRGEVSLDAAREAGYDAVDPSPDPASQLEREEARRAVLEELQSLSPAHREILLLRHFEELSYREMARVLDCPVGTVMSRLYAARRALAARLSSRGEPVGRSSRTGRSSLTATSDRRGAGGGVR
jgi:RNA polymerase sigma-70 factor (ECF subfamily)